MTEMNRIPNANTRGIAHIVRLGEKQREARLRLFRNVIRRDEDYVG